MRLAIISHTEHFKDSNGVIKGWGPTIREINFLATVFDEIYHVACFSEGVPPDSSLGYDSENIHFIALPTSGGKSLMDKISVLTTAPTVIRKLSSIIDKVDAIQIRVPTGMANYLLPYLTIKKIKPLLWVKYAGNWNQENAPKGYQFQRWWLKRNFLNCPVTINGHWPKQLPHCFTFENPCLDEKERMLGREIINSKKYDAPFTAVFIGRIESEKGVQRILDALPEMAKQKIKTIHFIGEGKERASFESIAKAQSLVECLFHGSVSRDQIPAFLKESHFLLLPSTASEGFPKVIAEGGNYGAIPIVSDVSSIGQYINETNGFLWNRNSDFNEFVRELNFGSDMLKAKAKNSFDMANDFTFDNYYKKLKQHIFNDR